MTATCETCRFWGAAPEAWSYPIEGLRLCSRIPHGADCYSFNDDAERVLKPQFVGIPAFVNDESWCSASLVTLASFGCNEHQPKEA